MGPVPTFGGLLVLMVVFGFAAVPVIFGIMQANRKRELEHLERMKALEMGLVPPGETAWPVGACIAIGAGVPIAALVVALAATLNPPSKYLAFEERADWLAQNSTDYFGLVWGCAAGVGIIAVIVGGILTWRVLSRSRSATLTAIPPYPTNAKTLLDPDAFDTVGRRG
jgi:hypothetical protein